MPKPLWSKLSALDILALALALLPGAVIAVGVLGSFALLFAYLALYLAVALQSMPAATMTSGGGGCPGQSFGRSPRCWRRSPASRN